MAATVTDQLEVEWQFAVPDVSSVLTWLQGAAVPGYTVMPGKTKNLDDTYFDTEDWRLHRAGYTCRVRRKGDSAELTLKSMAAAVDAVRSRREITEELAERDGKDPATAPGPCGQMIRCIAGRHPLRPVFSVQTQRRIFILSDAAGQLAEIAVDETAIPVDEAPPVRLSRVEVEVDGAAVERAQRFVDVLIAAASLGPAGTSKFEAALAATGQRVPSAGDLGSTSVTDRLTAGEAAYAILRKQFAVFLANEAGTRLGEDIEALHDMRVASRRMRAAMSAFAAYLSPRVQPLRDQLGWVAALLGDVRDLDVQIERMVEWRAGFTEAEGHLLDGVEGLLRARRDAARNRMLSGLDSRRYDAFVLRFSVALRRGASRSFAPGRQPLLAIAPDLVERRYRRLRRSGDGIRAGSPPEAYHALRIDAKKLRYALEFVGPVYGRQATDFSARVTALQDLLGLHQDADVAQHMLQEMAQSSGRRLGPAALLVMGAISERYRRHAGELRADFPTVYKPLAGQEWRRLLKLMESRRPLPVSSPGTN